VVSRVSKSPNKKTAEKLERKLLMERDAGRLNASAVTVNELLANVVLDYEINGKSLRWADVICRNHLRPFFGHLRANRVDSVLLQRFIAKRQAEGAANATINNNLALLKRAYNLAAQATPPLIGRVPHFPMLKVDNVRKGFFEYDEYLRVREALPDDLKPLLVFAYYTGCRAGELLGLRWNQVDLEERVCRLEPGETKNGYARTIPLPVQLYEVLVIQKQFRDQYWPDCGLVFFQHRNGKPIRYYRNGWAKACHAAGLWDEEAQEPTKLFHDLRRSGVRDLVRSGTPETVAMAISGHRTRSVFDRYNIVSEQDLKQAAQRLADYRETKAKAHRGDQCSTDVQLAPRVQ
jgi:integrase